MQTSKTESELEVIAKIMGNSKKSTIKVHRHVWTVEEENLALDLYFSGAKDGEIAIAVKKTELKLSSMKMKLGNIKFLDTGDGLTNVSTLTRTLYNKRVDSL